MITHVLGKASDKFQSLLKSFFLNNSQNLQKYQYRAVRHCPDKIVPSNQSPQKLTSPMPEATRIFVGLVKVA